MTRWARSPALEAAACQMYRCEVTRRAASISRMSFQVFGLPVSRGVAIGRAVMVASSRVDVAHYFIDEIRVEAEIGRLRVARDAVAAELETLQRDLPTEAPAELSALLDVHLMLLHDDTLTGATKHWIRERHYNAEWALSAQLEVLARQFDEMEDEYLRERKADLEQVIERMLRALSRKVISPLGSPELAAPSRDFGGSVVALTVTKVFSVLNELSVWPGVNDCFG